MKFCGALLLVFCGFSAFGRAAEVNLATLTCVRYQNEIIAQPAASRGADSINTVMWLFGYSVAKAGAHVMYSDALAPFGFALDNECKSNPAESLLHALAAVKPEPRNPMDLTTLECAAFASRHVELARTDPESATTIMMWLFGFSVARSGSQIFEAESLSFFQTALLADCAKNPKQTLFDALTAVKTSKPAK